jgi:hypothetical protein
LDLLPISQVSSLVKGLLKCDCVSRFRIRENIGVIKLHVFLLLSFLGQRTPFYPSGCLCFKKDKCCLAPTGLLSGSRRYYKRNLSSMAIADVVSRFLICVRTILSEHHFYEPIADHPFIGWRLFGLTLDSWNLLVTTLNSQTKMQGKTTGKQYNFDAVTSCKFNFTLT